jgi:hypothetical protein
MYENPPASTYRRLMWSGIWSVDASPEISAGIFYRETQKAWSISLKAKPVCNCQRARAGSAMARPFLSRTLYIVFQKFDPRLILSAVSLYFGPLST